MPVQINDAQYLWIEAGAMSGGPRHQTEFADDVAEFFDDDTREMELISGEGEVHSDRAPVHDSLVVGSPPARRVPSGVVRVARRRSVGAS